jgi:cyclopropane fatty-acyl-phospholipid synthase-like methyltransferase
MKNYDLSFYEKKKVNSAEELKPKGYEKQIECDIKFLKQFSDKNKVLLDLGSRTGLTINSLINDFKKIYAIEKFEHFSKFINENIVVINKDIREIEYKNNFDIVSAFGVFNHLNDKDTFSLYKKVFKSLKKGGIFIIKHAMGLERDVILNTSDYWAIYREKNKEMGFLEDAGFKIKEINEMYDNFYKKEDVNYYAIVGVKKIK